MRRPIFSFLVALVAAGLVSPAFAQAPTNQKEPEVSKPASGDDALSPSTLPKARQNVKEEGANRVDELSPDEARRLERIRAKAAAAKPQDAKPGSVKSESVKSEDNKPKDVEAQRAAAPKQVAKAPPAAAETKSPAAPKELARAPVSDGKPAVETARKAMPFRAPRQASRRAHRLSRDTADLDARRWRRWDDAPPRRRWPEFADRAPRVGDVVPYDAPFYAPPPGYGRGRGYPQYPGEGGYGYPPPGYGRW